MFKVHLFTMSHSMSCASTVREGSRFIGYLFAAVSSIMVVTIMDGTGPYSHRYRLHNVYTQQQGSINSGFVCGSCTVQYGRPLYRRRAEHPGIDAT